MMKYMYEQQYQQYSTRKMLALLAHDLAHTYPNTVSQRFTFVDI